MKQLALQFVAVILISLVTIVTFAGYFSTSKNLPLKRKLNHRVKNQWIIKSNGMFNKTNIVKAPRIKEKLPLIYVVTPTHESPYQVPELTALGNTLKNVENIKWIIVEDSLTISKSLSKFISRFNIPFVHLNEPVSKEDLAMDYIDRPRGKAQRNKALDWIRSNANIDGVVLFADDDNTYDPQLFKEIRRTKGVSMFPVGLVTGYQITSPVVVNGTVTKLYDSYGQDRVFQVDMAEFSVSVRRIVKHPKAQFYGAAGYLETLFLEGLDLKMAEIEPLADNCTQILAFHTNSVKPPRNNQ